ncbi:hypothetical protein D3C84_593600 [compost metagenome]
MRATRRQRLHLRPGRIIRTGDKIDLQLDKVRQRLHRMIGLHGRVETAEIHQHTPGLGLDFDGRATELVAQHGKPRAEQCPAAWRQQRGISLWRTREILVQQQVGAVGPRGEVIDHGDPWCKAPGGRLPVMIEAVVVDNDPVKRRLELQQRLERSDIRLPWQHGFDGLLRVFILVALRQREGFETFGPQCLQPMSR